MMENFYGGMGLDKEDTGFSEAEALNEQERREREVTHRELAERRDRPNHSYYIFEDGKRGEALDVLTNEGRGKDDAFTFLKDNFGEDPGNSAGIALEFSKSQENQDEKVIEFFKRHGLNIIDKYRVDEGEVGDIKDNVIPFPKKEDLPKAA